MKTLTLSLILLCIFVAVFSKPSPYYYNKHMELLQHPKLSSMREWQNVINNQIEDKIMQNKIDKKVGENIVQNKVDDKTENNMSSDFKIPPMRDDLMSKLKSVATQVRLRRAAEESEKIQETHNSCPEQHTD